MHRVRNLCAQLTGQACQAAAAEPAKLNLRLLNPTKYLSNYSYPEEFAKLDLDAVKADIIKVMTTSQDFWPADYGHYGPLFIRLTWHSAGTYRVHDGRGGGGTGNMRFYPLNSWPDNGNLDKARRLLWPVKTKYGKKLSWADLMIFAGNCALDHMGFQTLGFAGGREDIWEPEEDIDWGPEKEWLADERHDDKYELEESSALGADHMGLIYVNPGGPGGNPDPMGSAKRIRQTFARMAMNDEETVALIAGGHTFGKAHGAGVGDLHVGPEPEAAGIEEQGMGWKSSFGSGKGVDAITSGFEGAWTQNPTRWDNEYFDNLFGFEWELGKAPSGANQWYPKDGAAKDSVPDAHDPNRKHPPMMLTSDLALRTDPSYTAISKRFHENPGQFQQAFAKAWYKLTHRDMGPPARFLGKYVPAEKFIWQDPCPVLDHELVDGQNIEVLKQKILASGCSIGALVRTAWASASTYRHTDHRGGANGARIRLAPQKDWAANNPAELAEVLKTLQGIQAGSTKKVSIADLIVLGGCAAIEEAAKKAGVDVRVPFTPGRTDATAEMTDAESFAVLEPKSDGFRNHNSTPAQLVDKAFMLKLTAPEMAVLVAGLRVLGGNCGGNEAGVLTRRLETLTNDYFVNLLDVDTVWQPKGENLYEGRSYGTGEMKWTATQADLVFGRNSELRAIAEYYSEDESKEEFVKDFAVAWAKVMNLDRFDLHR